MAGQRVLAEGFAAGMLTQTASPLLTEAAQTCLRCLPSHLERFTHQGGSMGRELLAYCESHGRAMQWLQA